MTLGLILNLYSKINEYASLFLIHRKDVIIPYIKDVTIDETRTLFLNPYKGAAFFRSSWCGSRIESNTDNNFFFKLAFDSNKIQIPHTRYGYVMQPKVYSLTNFLYKKIALKFMSKDKMNFLLSQYPICSGIWPVIPKSHRSEINSEIIKVLLYLYLKIPSESLVKYLYIKWPECCMESKFEDFLNVKLKEIELFQNQNLDNLLFNEFKMINDFKQTELIGDLYMPSLFIL